MHEVKLTYVLRTVSILFIFILVFLFLRLNSLKRYNIEESSGGEIRIDYEHNISSSDNRSPEFTYNLESLFPHQLIPKIIEPVIITEPVIDVPVPTLQFVGMIETDKKLIYSFRNRDTNRLLLLEEGACVDGLTLLPVERPVNGTDEGNVFILKKQSITFQVDKE